MKKESVERNLCSYKDISARFLFSKKRKLDLQYSQIYAVRLVAIRKKLIQAAEKKWKEKCVIKQLSELAENEECVIIGTLFRKMELQPSILKEISQEEGVLPMPPSKKYISDDDELILEEEQQRIVLVGNVSLPTAITGTIVAVYGHAQAGGKFYVEDYCFSELPPQSSTQMDQCLRDGEDRYIVFLSGLGVGSKQENPFKLQLLLDILTGKLATEEDQMKFSNICRVIIAGNSLSRDTQDKDSEKIVDFHYAENSARKPKEDIPLVEIDITSRVISTNETFSFGSPNGNQLTICSTTTAKYLSRNTQAKSVEAVKRLDDILVQLSSSVPVDVMAGEYDPANQFLPQQPLHKCMFPSAMSYQSLRSVTNPYEAIVGGIRLLGTSGQNISNIYQFSGFEQRLDILESTLKCGHISPTSPDTLSCYPYRDEDPFILNECPHIYFAGNQPKFEVRHVEGECGQTVTLLCVPAFEESGIAVMVNLRDLSCTPLHVDTSIY